MPSDAASVARSILTGESAPGLVWNAFITASRSSIVSDPCSSIRCFPPYPLVARIVVSHVCVSMNSVNRMTRSSLNSPPGLRYSSSHLSMASALESFLPEFAFAHASSSSSMTDSSRESASASPAFFSITSSSASSTSCSSAASSVAFWIASYRDFSSRLSNLRRLPSERWETYFSNVLQNAAGDEKSLFLSSIITKAVPNLPPFFPTDAMRESMNRLSSSWMCRSPGV